MTAVEYRIGDLFDQPDLDAIGHGVNCRGVMGSGIAPMFRRRDEQMYLAYRRHCQEGTLRLGGMFPWKPSTGPAVYNLASQDAPGPNADLAAVRSSLRLALTHAAANGITSLGLPRIGAGIGGLSWADVRRVIEEEAAASPVQVVVVSLPSADAPSAHSPRSR